MKECTSECVGRGWHNHGSKRVRLYMIEDTETERARGPWLPIETAPKDGTRIDLWVKPLGNRPGAKSFRYPDCVWHKSYWVPIHEQVIDDDDDEDCGIGKERVSHWMPIPKGPEG